MRNLKRALSLTLASVMLLGMMVVGSSAAAGYDDVKETDNVEAIEVLQTVGIMVGDERGFGPDRPVNRAEMAVIMGLLLNLDYNYYTATCPFNDVYDWARGWVGACAANGIVSGRGDGVYDPGATVTAVEGASMLMRALGYFKYPSDYADGFEVSTVRQGTTIGIFKGVGSSATEPMTRNQVAQMVLNALKSGMVQPDGNTLNYFDTNGNVIATGGKINYVYVTSDEAYATAIRNIQATSMGSTNNAPIVELGEQLYGGDLKLYGEGSSIRDREWDVFGRPARRWEYKGQEIGTYVKKELLKQEYTAKVTGQTLYELLGKSTVDNYDFQIAVDGVYTTDTDASTILRGAWFDKNDLYRTNKDAVGRTEKGVLTQVYVDTDFDKSEDYHVYIAIINTYLAKANENYDSKDDDVSLRVWRLDYTGTIAAPTFAKSNGDKPYEDYTSTDNDYTDVKAKGEDFDLVKDVKEDELYLVQVADGEIQSVEAPEILSAVTIDAFKLGDRVTTGGETYEYASTARYDVEAIENYTDGSGTINLKDLTYNVILDQYGYLIGLELNEDNNQYVFLTGLEEGASNLYAKQIDGNIIHLDGTMETVKIDMTKSRCGQPGHTDHRLLAHNTGDAQKNLSQLNTWCTYTVDTNGVYTLTMVPVSTTANLTSTGTNAIKKAQFAQDVALYNDGASEREEGKDTKSINTKRVSLKASAGNEYVYGNDNTVYITVSLDSIAVDDDFGGTSRNIIDDVDTVATGVKNVDLKAIELGEKDENNFYYPDEEIYTLYDNKGAVIAAVVIGDDEGTTSTYAYIHTSKLEEESYNGTGASKAAGDGKWTWTRYAIVNGVKTLLKEVDDQPEYLKPMKQGEWYEIKYDSDGNVRKATLVVPTNSKVDADGDVAKWIAEVVDVEGSVNEYDTVVLLDVTTVDGLTFKNGTLWTNTAQTKGFSVDPDVKVVLAVAGKSGASYKQSDRTYSGSAFDDTFDGYTGYSGLEQALREMNAEKSGDFTKATVQIGAIMENGRATSIVINDMNKAPDNRPNGGGSNDTDSKVTADNDTVKNTLTKSVSGSTNVNSRGNGSWTVNITAPDWVADTATANITYDLYVNGKFDQTYTANNVSKTSGVYTATGSDNGFDTNDKLTVKVTDVDWSAVKVQVKGAELDKNASTDVLTAKTTAADDIKFTVDAAKYSNAAAAKYTVSGLTTTPAEATGVASQQIISGVKANGNGYVTITVTGLTAVEPPKPATEYDVTVASAVKDTLEFAVMDAVPTAATIPADSEWISTNVTAKKDQYVLVRSAVDGVNLSGTHAAMWAPATPGTAAADATNVSTTSVYYFPMPEDDVIITSTANDKIGIKAGFVKADATVVNLQADKDATSLNTMAKKVPYAVDWINANTTYTAVAVKNLNGDITGMTVNGLDVTTINISDAAKKVTINDKTVVTNGTDNKLSDALGLVGVDATNTAGKFFYKEVAAGTKSALPKLTANLGGNVAEGDIYKTNGDDGYYHITAASVGGTDTADSDSIDIAGGDAKNAPTKTLVIAAADKIEVGTNSILVKPDATLSIEITFAAADANSTVGAAKALAAQITTLTGGNLAAGSWVTQANNVPNFGANATYGPATKGILTFSIDSATAAISVIEVVLSNAA